MAKKRQHTQHSEQKPVEPAAQETQTEDDLKINFSGVSKFFKRFNVGAVTVTVLILACMLLVLYIRMLPTALPVTDDWADNTIQQNIRSQISAQVDAEFPALPDQNRNALIDKRTKDFLTTNAAQYTQAKEQLSQEFKTYMRYTGDDGKQYTYLGDLDSYFWLRYTRNILRHGNTCDVIVNGECRDDHTIAPYGTPGSYNPSLHVFAILGVYKFITLFNSNYPLPAASFLVPVIVGILGVIPAFFIGRRLAGNIGGVFAAILIAINPLVLSRSMGSDNDIWNVVIPLFLIWMIIEALEAKTLKSRIIYSILSVIVIGVQAATWDAWWFSYLIILFAVASYIIFRILTTVIREKDPKFWKDSKVIATVIVLAIFYVGTFIVTTITSSYNSIGGMSAIDYISLPIKPLAHSALLDNAITSNYWPNVLTTVAELNKSSFADAVATMGGTLLFFGCMIGMLLLVLPRSKWGWKQYVLLAIGAMLSIYALNSNAGRITTILLIALPIGIILVTYLFEDEDADIAAALIILIWFMATTFAVYSGVRFILLMVPAFGIGFAVLAGRIYEWTTVYLQKETKIHEYIINVGVFFIIALLLIQPVRAGYQTARTFVPSIDDAWWDSLTKVEKESAPDAIINSWWDFGHWFKYVADRRVTADGTSQHTHVPRWLGLSLVTTNEDEAMGTLRMLTCGSDVYPDSSGDYGAYGMFLKKNNDPLLSQQMVREIIVLNKEQVKEYLIQRGYNAEEQLKIINATHCNPPEDYFITSGDMVGKSGVWAHFGLWNFSRAYIATKSKELSREDAVNDFTKRFNMTADQAEQIYFEAKSLTSEAEINSFAAPWPGYVTQSWLSCSENNYTSKCPLNIRIGQQGTSITTMEAFVYNKSAPEKSTISYGLYQNGQKVGGITNGTPALLVIAGPEKMQDINFKEQTSSVAVVYDSVNKRVLITDPLLAKSMFTQLFYLDGRYSDHFIKFDDRTSFTGTRVLIWKVDWDGKASRLNATQNTTTNKITSGNKTVVVN